jgi:hypothetical protein
MTEKELAWTILERGSGILAVACWAIKLRSGSFCVSGSRAKHLYAHQTSATHYGKDAGATGSINRSVPGDQTQLGVIWRPRVKSPNTSMCIKPARHYGKDAGATDPISRRWA